MSHLPKVSILVVLATWVGLAAVAIRVFVVGPVPSDKLMDAPSAAAAHQDASSADIRVPSTGRPRREAFQSHLGMQDVQQRLADLEAQTASEADETSPSQEPEAWMLDPETARAEAEAAWEQRVEDCYAEEVDPNWAPEVEDLFVDDLNAIAASISATDMEVRCRNKTCTVNLEFENYEAATLNYDKVLYHEYQENCSKETILPAPENDTGPYVATVLFDCSEAKWARLASAQ